MGLVALGVGPKDEVIVADINWVATVAPILHLGATPVLVIFCQALGALTQKKLETQLHHALKQ